MGHAKQVVIIEHRYLIRAGLEHFISEIPGLQVTKLFEGNEKKLIEKIKYKNPDLVIVNINSIIDNLLVFLNEIEKNSTIIGLANRSTNKNIISHFRYVIYQNDDKQTMQKILKKSVGLTYSLKNENVLSIREITILKYIVSGFTNRQIANELFLSIHTVITHRKNINRKLGIKTVSGLTVYAFMNHLVTLPHTD